MIDEPLVSIIITTFNRAKVIPPTIDSVLNQTYQNMEIIVVDDGSTDDTHDVIASFGDRLTYVRQENAGVEQARKQGILVSKGAYLNFLDDDDLMSPRKIARQIEIFKENPDLGLVHCRYHYIDKDGNLLETTGHLPEGDVLKPLMWGCFPWSGGPLVRRELLQHQPKYDHRDWYGDWGMWLRVALAGYLFGCAQEPLGSYRIVSGSMTDEKVGNAERLVFHILDDIFSQHKLPDAVIAEKKQIYAGWHFWIACRYYVGGFWEDGKRSLSKVIENRPDLLKKPDQLLLLLYWDALSPRGRVGDPVKFIDDFFDHIPSIASPVREYRNRLLSQIHFGLALHDLGANRIDEGRNKLSQAVKLYPQLFKQVDNLVNTIHDYCSKMTLEEPMQFINTLIENLPVQSENVQAIHRRLSSEILITTAFQDFAKGDYRPVPRQVIKAVSKSPGLVKNRGVLSIFFKSLPSKIR